MSIHLSPSPKIFAVVTSAPSGCRCCSAVDTSHKGSMDPGHVRLTPSTSSLLHGSHPGTTPWITHPIARALAHADGGRPRPRQRGGNGRHRRALAAPQRLIDKQTAGGATRRPLDAFLSPRCIRRTLPHSPLRSQTPPPPLSLPFQLALRLRCSPALSSCSSPPSPRPG